ncbi:partner and localizer of BRCA2 [Stegastes partitus]|uniref:Partner and localizer of BRCA2 n=1 Tax=Stegastes partitus TaxID=144197 RepID=A0A9Y4NNB6_9TELE|nr:PREDICTED: partner and localizer of BRCA2 [Stegastes partitus]
MEPNVGDILPYEDQLRTTLHCDDKEKLRRKLAQLQREYLRTAQRLQRAERFEAVRRHVRSRITEQNHQDQRDPDSSSCLNPSSSIPNNNNATDPGVPQSQGHTEGEIHKLSVVSPADSDNARRSQVIRFLLPSDAACPQTPDPCHDASRAHRPSPALRLRSRSSRLRWEKRSAEVGRSTDYSEKHQEQSEGMESAATTEEEEKVNSEGMNVANESEELFSSTESESPSLLLTHWNNNGCTETGDIDVMEIQGHEQQRQKETHSRTEEKNESKSTDLLLTCCNLEESRQDGTQNGRMKEKERVEDGENNREQTEKRLCEENSSKDNKQNATENEHESSVQVKEEKNGITGDGNGVSLLDSCTLVEGLLFPVEYYVRTTRRMTLSQSQPDMQAVIISQLSMGRKRRSQGRGRGMSRTTNNGERSDQHTQIDSSAVTPASTSVEPLKVSHVQNFSASSNQSSSEILDHIYTGQINSDACFSPMATTARPTRGRRRKRGRGRGRRSPQTPRSSLGLDSYQLSCEQTSGDPHPTSTPVSSFKPLHGADRPKPCLPPGETVAVADGSQPVSTLSTCSQSCSESNGTLSNSAYQHQRDVYPIFLKNSVNANKPSQMNRGTSSWRSLLLPASPPAQTSLLPLPSLSSGPLLNSLMKLDIPQDFHLPDDQFASLKLHKLRQVTMESGVECFSSPSYNTRSSNRSSSSDPVTPLLLPLSLTPTVADAPHSNVEQRADSQPVDLPITSIEHKITDKLIDQPVSGEPSDRDITDEEQQTENLPAETHSSPTESASVCAEDLVDKGNETETLNSCSQSSLSVSSTHRSIQYTHKPQPHLNFADRPAVNDNVTGPSAKIQQPASEKQTDYCYLDRPLEEQRSFSSQTENQAVIETLSFACSPQETPEEPSDSFTAFHTCNDTTAVQESPVTLLNVKSPAEDSKKPPDHSENLSTDKLIGNKTTCVPQHSVHSQLLLTSPPASAPGPFITPHLPSSTLTSSLALPSLGLTPHPVTCGLTSSPSAPSLTLPPPHSPSTQALSPPALSRCPSITSLPPSQPTVSLSGQIQASCEPPVTGDQCHRDGQVSPRTEEKEQEPTMRCTTTLKAAAGGSLVDACCFPGSSGGLCVAAAGKWAVCLWSQTSASDWNLVHTWTFNEPVINVFAVPDAAGLMCVTLGQLEIREVRLLSCSSLVQTLFCEGVIQAVVGVSKSRVVTSSHSATGSTLQVFTLSDTSSSPSSLPLVSPGVCVGALAPVDGLSDALIGTDEGGHLFVWNLKTGQLLSRVLLGDGLSHTACLRGYSYCGVLFVLLQHQFLSSLEEEEKEAKIKDGMLWDKEMKTALFSLVAINPLSGKSILATQLYPPKAWSGRLCEADVSCSSVVGLSQNGSVCVWELIGRRASRMVWAPESDGWQLARWGGGGTLVTGHHNGDVMLHCCSTNQTDLHH